MFSFHKRCDVQILFLKAQVMALQERNDRLTEALAHKEGIPIQMPYAYPTVPPLSPSLIAEAKDQGGWFDNKKPAQVMTVSAPGIPSKIVKEKSK